MAISRQLVDFEAYLVGHPAYALAEEAKITPEERTGVYRLRARIQQYEIQQHHNLVMLFKALTTFVATGNTKSS